MICEKMIYGDAVDRVDQNFNYYSGYAGRWHKAWSKLKKEIRKDEER
jgi:hypothetical protein